MAYPLGAMKPVWLLAVLFIAGCQVKTPDSFYDHPMGDDAMPIATALCGPNKGGFIEFRNHRTEHVTYCCDHHRGFYPSGNSCHWEVLGAKPRPPKRVSK